MCERTKYMIAVYPSITATCVTAHCCITYDVLVHAHTHTHTHTHHNHTKAHNTCACPLIVQPMQYIDDKYNGIENYLTYIGFDASWQAQLREGFAPRSESPRRVLSIDV